MSIARRFVDMVTQKFDAPEAILACLQPEIERLEAKEQARKIQRRGNREPGGNPRRGRPRLTPEQAAESKGRGRELHRLWMRRKRAMDNGL